MDKILNGLAQLGFSVPTLVAQLLNFAILFGIVYLFLLKPFLKKVDERSRKVRESIEQAEAIQQKAANTEAEIKKQLEAASREAVLTIDVVLDVCGRSRSQERRGGYLQTRSSAGYYDHSSSRPSDRHPLPRDV